MAHPSFGSFIDFRLMYSAYSKVPADNLNLSPASSKSKVYRTIELGMLPVEGQLCHDKTNIFPNELAIAWIRINAGVPDDTNQSRPNQAEVQFGMEAYL